MGKKVEKYCFSNAFYAVLVKSAEKIEKVHSSKYKNSSEWLWNSNKSIENSILSDGKKICGSRCYAFLFPTTV